MGKILSEGVRRNSEREPLCLLSMDPSYIFLNMIAESRRIRGLQSRNIHRAKWRKRDGERGQRDRVGGTERGGVHNGM